MLSFFVHNEANFIPFHCQEQSKEYVISITLDNTASGKDDCYLKIQTKCRDLVYSLAGVILLDFIIRVWWQEKCLRPKIK